MKLLTQVVPWDFLLKSWKLSAEQLQSLCRKDDITPYCIIRKFADKISGKPVYECSPCVGDELADLVAVGRRSFERRFKQATNNSVLEYIHRIKIEAAKRSFETSRKNMNEVMFDVGYTDTKAFRTVFKKVTGLTPSFFKDLQGEKRKSIDKL